MIDSRPEPVPFEEFSTLFNSIDEGYADGYIEVYAPVDWETKSERAKKLRELREPIREAIESTTREILTEGDG